MAVGAASRYIKHIDAERVAESAATRRFQATANFDRLSEADAILICVPDAAHAAARAGPAATSRTTAEAIGRRLRPGQLVVLE